MTQRCPGGADIRLAGEDLRALDQHAPEPSRAWRSRHPCGADRVDRAVDVTAISSPTQGPQDSCYSARPKSDDGQW